MKQDTSGLQKRAAARRRRILAHRAAGFEEAEAWDLEYWQSRTPEERLAAFMALRRDVQLVREAKERDRNAGSTEPYRS